MAADRDDLERVRQAVNLVELFEGVTTVRKVRGSFKALCPFHTEKTPSLSIDPARGLYHCFGCGVGGDVFTFVQETQGLSFVEALEMLAERSGVVIRRDPRAAQRRERRSRLIEAVAEAGRYYRDRLKSADDAGHARSYVRGRKYGVDVVDRFELGYAPDRPDALISHLRGLGYKDTDILRAGLARRVGSGRLMDQMRGRLMFPIHNVRGDMVGFGGRLLRGEGPKYLNTPETPLYKKSELLYGLDKARSAISREELGVVVEGYTDVIAFHLADLPLAVATCGTALGEAHFDLLRRFSSRIVLAFDADAAGAGAAVRGDELSITSDLGLDLRVAVMPEGRDPADLVFDDKGDLLREAVDGSAPITEFRINRLLEQHNLGEREARTRAMREAAELIARHPDAAARYQHALYVAGRTHMSIDLVQAEIERNATTGRRSRSPAGRRADAQPVPTRPVASGRMDRSERDLLRHLMGGTAEHDRVRPELFEHDQAVSLARWLLAEGRHLDKGIPVPLDGLKDQAMAAMARRLAVMATPLLPFEDVMSHLEARAVGHRKDEILVILEGIDQKKDPEAYTQALAELIALQEKGH
ncbi:DNA primase [Candidatus Spongiisocius sp.]|uniref:DNA primase n=1 Tax=Candidatus Spongiisocius sp. TaxID=3101273 RepID=UPI003B5C5016